MATPTLLLQRRLRPVRGRRLPDALWPSRSSQGARRGVSTTSASAPCANKVEGAGGRPRQRVGHAFSRRACATRARRSAARSRALRLPRLLLRGSGTIRRAHLECCTEGEAAERAASPVRSRSSGRINSEVPTARRRARRRALPDDETSWLDGVSVDYRMALQRAPSNTSRSTPEPRVDGLPRELEEKRDEGWPDPWLTISAGRYRRRSPSAG